jgi:hypothetical protein
LAATDITPPTPLNKGGARGGNCLSSRIIISPYIPPTIKVIPYIPPLIRGARGVNDNWEHQVHNVRKQTQFLDSLIPLT